MKKTKDQERIELLESKLKWAYESIIDLRSEVRNLNELEQKVVILSKLKDINNEQKFCLKDDLFEIKVIVFVTAIITIFFGIVGLSVILT